MLHRTSREEEVAASWRPKRGCSAASDSTSRVLSFEIAQLVPLQGSKKTNSSGFYFVVADFEEQGLEGRSRHHVIENHPFHLSVVYEDRL